MSHPVGLPDLFLDRSLGGILVPGLLRNAGLRLTTLAEHYGVPADEDIGDEEWLELAGSRGWVVFMKDGQIRRNVAERAAVERFGVRCFCIPNQSLTGAEMAERFLRHLPSITETCLTDVGPFIYAVHQRRIERML